MQMIQSLVGSVSKKPAVNAGITPQTLNLRLHIDKPATDQMRMDRGSCRDSLVPIAAKAIELILTLPDTVQSA